MSCSCHGKQGTRVDGTVLPTDQCVTCAAKHLSMARAAWGEFTYELDNRYWCAGHVRLAVEHLKFDHRDLALTLRDIAVTMEDATDQDMRDIASRLDIAVNKVLSLRKAEKPVIQQRLNVVAGRSQQTDIIIPLGTGTAHENDELRILLRSIERHAVNLNRIIVVSDAAPEWLTNVEIFPFKDVYENNKDANLIEKTLAAIEKYEVRSFVWCSDDFVFLKDMILNCIPPMMAGRTKADFTKDNQWHKRMRATFDWAKARSGVELRCDFESHAPQYFPDAKRLAALARDIDYWTAPGLGIMTMFRVLEARYVDRSMPHQWFKQTYEEQQPLYDLALPGKMFLGYNDKAFMSGLREELFRMFPDRSRYESLDDAR